MCRDVLEFGLKVVGQVDDDAVSGYIIGERKYIAVCQSTDRGIHRCAPLVE